MADNINTNIITTATMQRKAPWIGIGVSGLWDNYMDALNDGQLNFPVYSEDLHWDKPDGFSLYECKIDPTLTGYPVTPENVEMKANINGDTNQVLGLVTPKYRIVQNHEAFKIMEQVTKAGGVITNVGMTEQGLCFMVARMNWVDINGDKFELNIMGTNSFNGGFPLALIITPVRIICQNMYRNLMANKDNVVRMRHETNVGERLKDHYDVAGKLLTYSNEFSATIFKLLDVMMTPSDYDKLLALAFPYPKPGGIREQMSRDRVDQHRQMFTDVYFDASDNRKFKQTAFGFVNAYYDYLSHADNTKNMKASWQDRRLSRLVSGEAVKQNVIKKALSLSSW